MCSGSRPSSSQAPRTASRTGIRSSEQIDAEAAIAREFVERGGHAAARGIAHPANAGRRRGRQRFHQRQHGARIGAQVGFEIQFAARQQNRDAVIADRPGEQHFVAGPHGSRRRCRRPGIEPADARSGDVHADRPCRARPPWCRRRRCATPARARRVGHGANFGFQNVRAGSPASRMIGDHQRFGPRAGNRQVVHRSVDRQFADGAAGKTQGLTTKLSVVMATRRAVDHRRAPRRPAVPWTSRTAGAQTGLRSAGGWPCRPRRAPFRSAGRGTGSWAACAWHDLPLVQAAESRLTSAALRCS